jgi:D-alanine-D-alanine ligase
MDMMKTNPNIAIVAGGYSSEREISLKSGTQIVRWIDKEKYNVFLIDINKEQWHCISPVKTEVDKSNFSIILNGNKIIFDFVIIAVHGHPGENGILQSYFDLLGIKYSTAGPQTSTLTFDKYLSKIYLEKYGIKTAESILLTKHSEYNTETIVAELGLPLVVKPNASGSSFGVSLVKSEAELENAITKAFEEDKVKVLVEKYISGTEVSCGVFFNGKELLSFPPTEIVSETEFFDYEAKYLGKSQEITPARLDNELIYEIQTLSRKIYNAFLCEGIVRVDFIIKDGKIPYFLEINTVPGMSAESIFPKQAQVKGISMTQIYDELIKTKLEL